MLITQLNTNHYAKENFADTNGIQSVTVERGYYVAQGGESEVLVNSFQGSNRIVWDSNTQENINVYREGVRQVKVNAFFSDTTNAVDLSESGKIKFDPILNLGERIEIEQSSIIQSLVRPEYPDFFEENLEVAPIATPVQTDFIFSRPIPLTKNLEKSYSLMIDGVHQQLNPGNSTTGGDYQEIPGTDGTFNRVSFNIPVGNPIQTTNVTLSSKGFYDASNINLKQLLQLQSDYNSSNIVIQRQLYTITGETTLGTTQTPGDNTIPQISEGNSVFNESFTPKSSLSTLKITSSLLYTSSGAAGGFHVNQHLHIDGALNAVIASLLRFDQISFGNRDIMHYEFQPSTISSITFNLRAGMDVAGTLILNSRASGAGNLGNIIQSFMLIEEIL